MTRTPDGSIQEKLTRARGTAEAANGMVRVEVDGAGEVRDLVIEPRAMRLASEDLAAAIRQALSAALGRARAALAGEPPMLPAAPELAEIQRGLNELGMDAQRRLGEFAAIAQQLAARLDARE